MKLILVVAALLLFASSSALAQTQETAKPTSEVDQLKQRLQQLEQAVTELKGQIEAIEAKKANPAPAIVDAKYSEPTAPPPAEPAPAEPAKPQDGKGESTFTIYGFAMLDAGYQLKQNHPDWFDVIRPTKLPSFPNEFAPWFAFVFGQGIQNYMNDAPVDVGIELTPGGDPRRPIKGVALPMWSMVAFLDHNWSKRFSTAAGYSFMDIDNSNGQAANAYHRGHYALTCCSIPRRT